MIRNVAITALFIGAAGSLSLIDRLNDVEVTLQRPDSVPAEAVQALREGRSLRASIIMREYLAGAADTTPAVALLAARAEAGRGDWERVAGLLAGRGWLDDVASGDGWYLLGRSQLELGRFEESGVSIERYLDRADDIDARDRGLALLRQAAALRGAERYGDALVIYDEAAELVPQIEDWIRLYSAGTAARAGDTTQVAERLARISDDLERDWGWRLRVRGYVNADDPAGAIGLAERFAADPSLDRDRRGEAWADAGEIRLMHGDTAGARAAFLSSMAVAPGGSGVEGARLLSDMPSPSPLEKLQIGRVYLRHGNSDRGIAGLEAYLDAGAGSEATRAAVRRELGRALFNARRYAAAEDLLMDVVAESTSPASAGAALYMAARAQYRDGRQTLARKTLLSVVDRYPGTAAATRAMYFSADLDHDAGELARARERYRRTIAMSTDIEEVGVAYMRLGGIAFVEGDFASALETYDAYRRTYPRGRRFQQATYWSAVALSRLGDEPAARERFVETQEWDPFSYYGGRAGLLLGRSFSAAQLAGSPESNATHTERVERALDGVDLLGEIGWTDAAAYELGRVRSHFSRETDTMYALAEALNRRGFTRSGISIGWEAYRREGAWNPRLLRIVYPFPYRDVIVAEANERGVDPFLAAALIRQESMFNASAVSPAGAIGLMQVLPATGAKLAHALGITEFSPDLLKQPDVNVHFGMAYLADQLRTYGGRLPVVLAAYNAGPHRIARWRAFPEFEDDELFAERIPYRETRDYVKIVQSNARIYAALYGNER